MRRLGKVTAAALVLGALLVAAPAAAQRAEGWRFYRTGDFAVVPMAPGISAGIGSNFTTLFALSSDFDYHIRGGLAIGGLLGLGFRSSVFGMQFGPQIKYKFKIGNTGHVPYVRGAFPLSILSGGGNTAFSLGIFQFGGGYRYFFHRMVGVGIDVSFTPTVVVDPSAFGMVVNINFGVEIKF